jgi:hypothetical protein
MFDKIKTYTLGFFVALSALLGALFLFFRNKAQVNKALQEDANTQALVKKEDLQVAANNEQLKLEEDKRKELQDVSIDTSKESIADLSKFFTDRK